MSVVGEIAWHRDLLADLGRVRAMVAAVRASVRPGDVVVDVGTGTGVLAVAAARAGASRVYAIEAVAEILELARQVAADNGVADRIVFVEGRSTEVELGKGERADVVLAELVGSFGLEESIVHCAADARRRFLRPGGRLVPDALRLLAAPTEEGGQLATWVPRLRREVGIDLSAVDARSRNLSLGVVAMSERLLARGGPALTCDLTRQEPGVLRGRVETVAERSGTMCGWVGWFDMLSRGQVILSTQPPTGESSWGNVLFPTGEPVAIQRGARAGLELRYDPPFWSWQTRVGEDCRAFCELDALSLSALARRRQPEEAVE